MCKKLLEISGLPWQDIINQTWRGPPKHMKDEGYIAGGPESDAFLPIKIGGYVKTFGEKKQAFLGGNILHLSKNRTPRCFVKPFSLTSGTFVSDTAGLILVRNIFSCFNFKKWDSTPFRQTFWPDKWDLREGYSGPNLGEKYFQLFQLL